MEMELEINPTEPIVEESANSTKEQARQEFSQANQRSLELQAQVEALLRSSYDPGLSLDQQRGALQQAKDLRLQLEAARQESLTKLDAWLGEIKKGFGI